MRWGSMSKAIQILSLSSHGVARGCNRSQDARKGEREGDLLGKENLSPLTDIFCLDTFLAVWYILAGFPFGFLFRLWSLSGSIPVCLLKAESLA